MDSNHYEKSDLMRGLFFAHKIAYYAFYYLRYSQLLVTFYSSAYGTWWGDDEFKRKQEDGRTAERRED